MEQIQGEVKILGGERLREIRTRPVNKAQGWKVHKGLLMNDLNTAAFKLHSETHSFPSRIFVVYIDGDNEL